MIHTHTHTHTYEQYLKMSVDLGLVFVHLFRFSILCIFPVLLGLFCSCVCFFALGLVLQYYAKRFTRNDISKISHFMSKNLNSGNENGVVNIILLVIFH